MTYFSALGNPLSGSGFPSTGLPGTTAWRAMLALVVVLVLLATTGWTAIRKHDMASGPLAAAEHAWQKASVAGRQLPDPGSPAGGVARFFRGLDTAQQQTLAKRYPLVVGNLGGAPLSLRYEANHTALRQARDEERERMVDDRLTDEGRAEAGQRMHRFESLMRPGRQILAFDPTGRGRAAEVFGNLGRAQRVSVVVPGVDTELLTFERTSRPYSAPVGMARSLERQQRISAPHVRTATVAWADYTAPIGLGVDAASGGPAQDGAERLTDMLDGLSASSQVPGARVSLFCHSYGSVVCGMAADDLPRRVTDVAVSGSPGMRADSVGELGTGARVWAMRDRDDWIADVPHLNFGGLGHGADPVSDGFGARRLSASGAIGHTGYFVPHTSSLDNFADIGTGSYRDVACDSTDSGCAAGTD